MSGFLAGLVLTSTLSMPAHGSASNCPDDVTPLDPCAASLFSSLAKETARCDHLELDLRTAEKNAEIELGNKKLDDFEAEIDRDNVRRDSVSAPIAWLVSAGAFILGVLVGGGIVSALVGR